MLFFPIEYRSVWSRAIAGDVFRSSRLPSCHFIIIFNATSRNLCLSSKPFDLTPQILPFMLLLNTYLNFKSPILQKKNLPPLLPLSVRDDLQFVI